MQPKLVRYQPHHTRFSLEGKREVCIRDKKKCEKKITESKGAFGKAIWTIGIFQLCILQNVPRDRNNNSPCPWLTHGHLLYHPSNGRHVDHVGPNPSIGSKMNKKTWPPVLLESKPNTVEKNTVDIFFAMKAIWVSPKIVVPQNGWFGGTPIFGNTHVDSCRCSILLYVKFREKSRDHGGIKPIKLPTGTHQAPTIARLEDLPWKDGCNDDVWPMTDPWDERYIYLHEWLIFMVNVAKYTIHGSYGWCISYSGITCKIWYANMKKSSWTQDILKTKEQSQVIRVVSVYSRHISDNKS